MVNPELIELRHQVDAHGKELAELRGNVQRLNKLAAAVNRQSRLQIVAIIISFCLTIFGGLYLQMKTLDKSIKLLERPMGRVERNLDELNKELRTQRQTSAPGGKQNN
jgi:prefoldin subunit 5